MPTAASTTEMMVIVMIVLMPMSTVTELIMH